jgi:hypothetical protein
MQKKYFLYIKIKILKIFLPIEVTNKNSLTPPAVFFSNFTNFAKNLQKKSATLY